MTGRSPYRLPQGVRFASLRRYQKQGGKDDEDSQSQRGGGFRPNTGFTNRVDRPRDLKGGVAVSFGEAPAGKPRPITAWYPLQTPREGHAFIYQ